MTTIRLSEENRKKLNTIKDELDAKSIDEVITVLLTCYDKMKNAKVVRLIE